MPKIYFEYDTRSDMVGPLALDASTIDALPPRLGYYLLADRHRGTFVVKYVGRTDERILADRLDEHVGTYSYFYYDIAGYELDSFLRECEEFHRYGGTRNLDNQAHPARPKGKAKALTGCAVEGCNGESKG